MTKLANNGAVTDRMMFWQFRADGRTTMRLPFQPQFPCLGRVEEPREKGGSLRSERRKEEAIFGKPVAIGAKGIESFLQDTPP